MKRLTTIALFFCKLALAGDSDWLCTEESSERRNGAILSCGIGLEHTESRARAAAFHDAKDEFNRVCAGMECKHTVANPLRTQCFPIKNGYKCYRLISFSVAPVVEPKPVWHPTVVQRLQHSRKVKYFYEAQAELIESHMATTNRLLREIALIH